MAQKRVAVVGGGAAGVSLIWALTSQPGPELEVQATLFHDDTVVGGHSHTIGVWFDGGGKGHVATGPTSHKVYPIDIGVQFVNPMLYPNLYQQLGTPDLAQVTLKAHPELKISGAFNDELVWGNFHAYQTSPRFTVCYDAATKQLAQKFQHDVNWAPLLTIGGQNVMSMTVGQYLQAAGYDQSSNFFRYLLIPYLSIINGYGTSDLLETTIEDLYPIFTKIPIVQQLGPYAAFTQPGTGWDRFENGAQQWVETMAQLATGGGAVVNTSTVARSVYPTGSGVTVEWISAKDAEHVARDPSYQPNVLSDTFDSVVLTTDMTTNRSLLNNPNNPFWATQSGYISEQKFELIPGVCYIHQDDSLLAPSLTDGKEDGQFTGYFAWGQTDPDNPFNLPYDLTNSFQTYFMNNIIGTPYHCYVSMYAQAAQAKLPDPNKTIMKKTWRHGRWVASFFDAAKKALHAIQGMGNIWFAGNNTTVDSEEGALVSAMVIAEKLSSFQYPFYGLNEATLMYQYFKNMMFPVPTPARAYAAQFVAATPHP